jgi:two-component system, OmpR family, manganese sensing sensor histidine kinase
MFLETRRRLALWYTTVTAVLLLVFASGFYAYVRSTLIERVDDTLHHVVEIVQRSLVIEPVTPGSTHVQVNVDASFRDNAGAVEDDRIDLEWFSPTGELLWSTLSEPLNFPLHFNDGAETIKLNADDVLRQLTERLERNGDVLGYLRVSHPWFEVAKPTRALMLDLVAGTSIMVGLVAMIGWFLSALAIEPLQQSYQYLRQFTADASHELRNPLALIQTTVQATLSDPEISPQEQRQQLEVVERLTRRLGNLVNDLLFLARQDSGIVQPKFQPCPLDALLTEVVEEQSAIAAQRDIRLSLELAETDPNPTDAEPFTLLGDYDQLSRLFINLVSNSLQYTPKAGAVTVKLNTTQYHGTPSLQVQVQDTGIGIPEEALPHLFERFYRVDPARSRSERATPGKTGTGLGLAIAKAICDTHHGSIRVQSKLKQGTTFTVQLPITPAPIR